MSWQFNPYAIPLFLSAVPLVVIVYVSWRRRANLAARLFLGFAGGALGLVLAYALELLSASLEGMLFWLGFEYLFHWAMVFWLLFAIAYSGYEAWLTRRRVLAFFVVPVVILVLVWTNQAHGLIWRTTAARMVGSVALFDRTYGSAFWIWMAYLAFLLLAGDFVLIRKAIRSPRYFQGQLGWLVLAFFLPFIGIALTIARLTPIPLLDLSPYGVALACIPVAVSLFRFHLFDLIPAAYQLVIESMGDAVIVCDAKARIVQVNSAAAQLVGRAASALVGAPVEPVLVLLADPETARRILDGGSGQQEIAIPAGSQQRYFDLRISPLRDNQMRITGQVFVLREITDRRRAEQQALDLAIERERVRVLETFIRDASHDFRTPISSILTSADLIDRFGDSAREQLARLSQLSAVGTPEALGTVVLGKRLSEIAAVVTKMRDKTSAVRASGERLEMLVESILEILELERAPQVSHRPCDVNRVVEELVRDYQATAARKNQQLQFQPDRALPRLLVDEWKLGRAVQKLLDNAIQFTPQYGAIAVRTRRRADEAIIEISDTGIGINADDLPHIFDSFYRVDRARSTTTGGVGMGLAIARRIVEAHGGRIDVDSTHEKGSDFRVCLPLNLEAVGDLPQ